MPLQIIRQDITKISCDAIVNPTNTSLIPTGGTDAAIHKAAGKDLLSACSEKTYLPYGEAFLTKGFRLPANFVIHTPAPFYDKSNKSLELLSLCYKSSLNLAKEKGFKSIAFPLIGAGAQGFPKAVVLKIALSTISEFLLFEELLVTLAVFDKDAFTLSEKLFDDIKEYIDDSYVSVHSDPRAERSRRLRKSYPCAPAPMMGSSRRIPLKSPSEVPCEFVCEKEAFSDIEAYLKLDESFSLKLLRLIDAKGISEVECYKRANVSKQTWYKIMNDKSYKPNKKTALSFAISLNLSLEETQTLLASVGFVLSESSLFDVIIMYCIERGIYDIFQIDSVLFKYDQETLFSKA